MHGTDKCFILCTSASIYRFLVEHLNSQTVSGHVPLKTCALQGEITDTELRQS